MNHKRRRPKTARAGCLMCKPWKANGCKGVSHLRTAGLRADYFARYDSKESAS